MAVIKGIIMGMACTYSQKQVTPFVKSLLSTGFTGDVHIGMDVASKEVPWFDRHGITHHPEPCQEQLKGAKEKRKGKKGAVVWLGTLNQRRWHYYKEWLAAGDYNAVWLTDIRDVFFQAPPFVTMPPELVLYVDKPELTDFQKAKIVHCLPKGTWEEMVATKMPNLCGGTVMGTKAGISELCDYMSQLHEEAEKLDGHICTRNDQHLLNYYSFKNNITRVGDNNGGKQMVYAKYEGAAINSGTPCDAKYHMLDKCNFKDRPCVVVNKDKVPFSVIHKWDRCGDLRMMVEHSSDGKGIYQGYSEANFPPKRVKTPLHGAAPTPAPAPTPWPLRPGEGTGPEPLYSNDVLYP